MRYENIELKNEVLQIDETKIKDLASKENNQDKGKMVTYDIDNISPDMSFLEMMDVLNEELASKGVDPVAFDHDCRRNMWIMLNVYKWRSSWA